MADTGAATEQTAADPTDPTGPYVSDEACLACHGGSFEANAANTEKYGQWNPPLFHPWRLQLLRQLP